MILQFVILSIFCSPFGSILSAEFMRASIHDKGDKDSVILLKAKSRASVSLNGEDVGVSLIMFFSLFGNGILLFCCLYYLSMLCDKSCSFFSVDCDQFSS